MNSFMSKAGDCIREFERLCASPRWQEAAQRDRAIRFALWAIAKMFAMGRAVYRNATLSNARSLLRFLFSPRFTLRSAFIAVTLLCFALAYDSRRNTDRMQMVRDVRLLRECECEHRISILSPRPAIWKWLEQNVFGEGYFSYLVFFRLNESLPFEQRLKLYDLNDRRNRWRNPQMVMLREGDNLQSLESLKKRRRIEIVTFENRRLGTGEFEFLEALDLESVSYKNASIDEEELIALASLSSFPHIIITLDDASRLTESDFSLMASMKRLSELTVPNAKLTPGMLASLGEMGSLSRLKLPGCEFAGNAPDRLAPLGACEYLEYLDLSRTNFTESDLRGVRRLNGLEVLNVANTAFNDDMLEILKPIRGELYLDAGDSLLTLTADECKERGIRLRYDLYQDEQVWRFR